MPITEEGKIFGHKKNRNDDKKYSEAKDWERFGIIIKIFGIIILETEIPSLHGNNHSGAQPGEKFLELSRTVCTVCILCTVCTVCESHTQ